ncbi:hypothetical protein NQ317_006596 [Molorchus minor]|uniref:Uncharacterized protein n=1 Tax=Molorchus minor TaxID=1323400 RepID=A0ABQ9JYW8_9CUCU|nr:hypothetical protein NQ317_006596 [Molorchus minor]
MEMPSNVGHATRCSTTHARTISTKLKLMKTLAL